MSWKQNLVIFWEDTHFGVHYQSQQKVSPGGTRRGNVASLEEIAQIEGFEKNKFSDRNNFSSLQNNLTRETPEGV